MLLRALQASSHALLVWLYMYIQHQNATHSVEGKSLGTFHRRAEGLGLLFGKGEAENNGSRRGLDCKVRIGALTECEERTGLNRDERHSKEKKEKGKQTYSGNAGSFGGWRGTESWAQPSGGQQICRAELWAPQLTGLLFGSQNKKKGMGHLTPPQQAGERDTFSA